MPHVEHIGPDGEVWPSVTELTSLLPQAWVWAWYKHSVEKDGWAGWLANKKKSDDGMVQGTLIHSEIERLIAHTISEGEACNEAHALYYAIAPNVDEWTAIEAHVVSNTYKYAGTADMIVRQSFETGLWVGDWKTSFSKSNTHPIQLAAYAMAWNEMTPGLLIDQGFIARVDKKSDTCTVKIDEYKGLSKYFPIVVSLRQIWDYQNNRGVWKKPEKKLKVVKGNV